MEALIKMLIEKGFIGIVLKSIQSQEILYYTNLYTEPDNYTEWITLYQRN